MSAPSPDRDSSHSSSGFEDGLGRRVLEFDRETGGMLERIVLRPELTAFEKAIAERLALVAALEDERFPRPRAVEARDGRLTVVSEYLAGRRLSDIIDCAAEHGIVAGLDAALGLLLEILPALARLHDAGLAHGALAPGRIMITPAGQFGILDAVYAEPLERLQLTRKRLWAELRLAFPPTAGIARFDKGADLAHAAMVTATLSVGRALQEKDYPDGIPGLRQEIHEIASIRGSKPFADAVDKFFAATLPLAGRRSTPTAEEAAIDLRKLVRKELGINTCQTAWLEFLQQLEAADAERAATEAVERDRRIAAAAQAARAGVDRRQWLDSGSTSAVAEPAPHGRRGEKPQATRGDAERAERARMDAERIGRERIDTQRERERLEGERADAERRERERAEDARREAERRERERMEAERLERERERVEAQRREQDRIERERLEAERVEQERLEQARVEGERRERERREAERRERERLEAERLELERIEQERLEAERREQERLEAERRERERQEAERLERERIEKARREAERLERERLEAERRERERLEAERREAERLERERLEAERRERERIEAERRERERLEAERLEQERIEKARLEAERLERERIDAERRERERERLEAENRARLEAERRERERAEQARVEAERIERERAEQARREAEQREAERREQERAEQARLEAERVEREKARLDAERREHERLEAERAAREARQRAEEARLAKEEADRAARAAKPDDETDHRAPAAAHHGSGPGKSGWLIPPNRAASFEPVAGETAPPAASRPYPVYVAPPEPPAWVEAPQPNQTKEEFLAALSAPAPVATKPAVVPIRLRMDEDRPSPSIRVVENRRPPAEDTPPSTDAYDPFRLPAERRPIPWKWIAAGVVLAAGAFAVSRGYTPNAAPVVETVRKVIPSSTPAELPPVAANVGRLIITTQPAGAKVTVDGKAAGETPLTIDNVKPGRHVVATVSAEGSARRTVRVEGGQTLTLDFPLYSGFAAISIPFVVQVSEAGKALGTSETQILLTPGRHVLRMVNRELEYSAAETVEITAGEVTRVDLDPMGRANINAAPWAEVFVDGEKIGETPLANVPIRLGVREIVFKHPQFPERKQTVTVTGGTPSTISVDFIK